ncbi:MAG: signal peptide peptidase SppA [Myxococcota bacterium]|nr:signal peptide peptidase SppA [Myxococcota bacterium]
MRAVFGLGRRLGHNGVRVVRRLVARSVLDKRADVAGLWLLARIGPRLGERRTRSVILSREPSPIALIDLLRALDAARSDARVAGVMLRFEGSPGGFARAAALRRAVARLREAGKPVWAWGESYDALGYYVACAADRVELPPSGSLHLVGLRSQQWFGRELLDKLGVRAEVVRIGSNKAAAEPLVRRSMSHEQREQVDAFQAEVFDELVSAIAAGRGMAAEAVRRHIDEGPHSAEAALERGLFDACRYPDEVEAELRERAARPTRPPGQGDGGPTSDEDSPLVDVATYFALHASDTGWQPLRRDLPRLAYVVTSGTIARGRSQRGIGSQRYGELFGRLMRDDAVRGVVLRIDSPGGDAVASDLLHRAVEQLAERKPVVVSLGEVAASGGYYLAAGGHRVLAERTTLTGSIGVVGGKLDLSGLYQQLGIDVDAIERGERAGLLSETRGFTPDERKAVQRQMRVLYATFKNRVARGRSLEPAAVEAAAQGRIWSGERARELGLVDVLGGPLEALAELCERAGLAVGERFALDIHPQRPALIGLPSWLRGLSLRARVHLD